MYWRGYKEHLERDPEEEMGIKTASGWQYEKK